MALQVTMMGVDHQCRVLEMAAAELALALGRGEEAPQLEVELATTLTVGWSTAPPKPAR